LAADVVGSGEDLIRFAERTFEHFDGAFQAAPLRLSRQVAGTSVEIATTVADQARVCAERIAGGPVAGADAASVKILSACAGELGLPTCPAVAGAMAALQEFEAALAPTRWRAYHYPPAGFWQLWDRDSRRGLQLMAGPAILPAWENGSPLRNLLKWALTSPGQGLLHAGTLAIDGRGMLCVGEGGSGKSGTVLAGLCNGLESVGDDYVLARVQGEAIHALALFNTLKCDAGGLRRLGLLDREDLTASGENWQGKHEFTFAQLTGHPPARDIRITALCLPVIARAPRTHFEPLSQREAFLALTLTGIRQLPGDRAENFALCAQITRQLPCMQLRLGTEPAEIADAIRTALTRGVSSC
jgi:hypothetical protein